jgi:predicted nucleic acid-binding protein
MLSKLKNIISSSTKESLKDYLQFFSINSEDKFFRNVDLKASIQAIRNKKLKIAIVKQNVYSDLYRCKQGLSAKETILSSNLRSGPAALFLVADVDFIILNTSEHPECQVWKEIVTDCKIRDIDFFNQFSNSEINVESNEKMPSQSSLAVEVHSVDWSKYDIVISFEISIPQSITRQYKNTLWAYYISHPCMKTYITSTQKIHDGYDVFLNQRFRKIKIFPANSKHEIDFPYHLHYYGCFHELLNKKLDNSFYRKGIFIEKHSGRILSENQIEQLNPFAPITYQSGSLNNVLNNLLNSKFFIRMGGEVGKRWGNSLIEAVAAGCLILGDPKEFHNNSLFTRYTSASSFEELMYKLNELNNNEYLYNKEVTKQRALLNYLCFDRPLNKLLLLKK